MISTKHKRYLTSVLQGGLGNQLFIYYSIKSIAKKMNRNPIFNIGFFDNDIEYGRDLELNKLEIDLKLYESKILKINLINRIFLKLASLNLTSLIQSESKYNQVATFNDTSFTNMFALGYFQNEEYFSLERENILSDIRKTSAYKAAKNRFTNISSKKTLVSVHLRSYGEVSNTSSTLTPDESYIKDALVKMGYNSQQFEVYVFTDNASFASKMMGDIPFFFYKEESGVDSMLSISMFDKIICSNSSFSWWAAYFSDSEEIYFPKFNNYSYYPTPRKCWELI